MAAEQRVTAAEQKAATAEQRAAAQYQSKMSPVARLQNALRALGSLHGDPALSKLKVDGIAGPGTTKAVNYAIAQRYVVMSSFPRPELTLQHVRQFAAGIATAVEGAVTAGGGTLQVQARRAPARAQGGSAMPTSLPEIPAPASNQKWVWWVVGGVSVLVALSLVASSVKRKRGSREAEA